MSATFREKLPARRESEPCTPEYVSLSEADRDNMRAFHTTEKRSEYIVRKYLADKYGDQAHVEKDRDGADLRVSINGGIERIEVKGTTASDIAWSKLKVSSQKSHDVLTTEGASIYRVVDVHGDCPRIYVLKHGRHFMLDHEPRWAVKPVPPEDYRYPLRGKPYRYDRPYDPVAADEWEIRR